jgi:hypothetical protein
MAIEKRSIGFGSDIAKIAKSIKADVVANNIAKIMGKQDCGCGKREEALNNPDLLINKIFYKK